jgi:hypothetical protein
MSGWGRAMGDWNNGWVLEEVAPSTSPGSRTQICSHHKACSHGKLFTVATPGLTICAGRFHCQAYRDPSTSRFCISIGFYLLDGLRSTTYFGTFPPVTVSFIDDQKYQSPIALPILSFGRASTSVLGRRFLQLANI